MDKIFDRSAYRRALLAPLTLATGVLLAIAVLAIFIHREDEAREVRQRMLRDVDAALRLAVESDTDKLTALLSVLRRDESLQTIFVRRDRAALLAATADTFEQLKQRHNVTHLYFMTPQREIFLRTHHPLRFGDIVERSTALEAERTGKLSSGLELGALGLFTLRVVTPWYDERRRLLGYLELGMEIDKTLARLHELTDLDILVLVEKNRLNRLKWEEGMRMIGRMPDWDRFPRFVLTGKTHGADASLLNYHPLSKGEIGDEGMIYAETQDSRIIGFDKAPLLDMNGQGVGYTVILTDATEIRATDRQALALLIGGIVLAWGVLVYWFSRTIDRVYDRLNLVERERDGFFLQSQLDSLTGLSHQAAFYRALEFHLDDCRRRQSALTLLMLDLDHFKQVNDTYGHRAGDEALRSVARVLRDSVRPEDRVARYGGEEFAIILPQVDLEEALPIAERIRCDVERLSIEADDRQFAVTLSIGLASFPRDADRYERLVSAADSALYAAKMDGRNCVRAVAQCDAKMVLNRQSSGACDAARET